MNNKLYLFLVATIFIIGSVLAITISPISTPTGTTSNASVVISYNFSTDYNNQTLFSWDGTNYSLYDDSLVLFYNFDNRSALGENDTRVVDLSKYGNNGTVIGGSNISWTPNGYYGGAYNFSGKVGYINGSSQGFNSSLPFTVSAWINSFDNSQVKGIVESRSLAGNWELSVGAVSNQARFSLFNTTNTGFTVDSTSASAVATGSWYFITGVYNGTAITIYVNSNNATTANVNGVGNNANNPVRIGTDTLNINRYFNGSIDQITIFNRTLSNREISELYISQITKYDIQNWTFQANQTLIRVNSTNTSYNYNYFLCSSNVTTQICGTQNNLLKVISNNNINTSFSNSIGVIRNDFYGTNDRNNLFSNMSRIDTNGDGILDTASNYQYHRTNLLNSKQTVIREDARLHQVTNPDGSFNTTASLTNTGNILYSESEVKWAYENNVKILYSIGSTPNYMANLTSGWCSSALYYTCTQNNVTAFASLVVSFVDNVTNNGLYNSSIILGIWNEPDASAFFLSNLSESIGNASIRSAQYNIIYNATYTAVKIKYPNINIGGPSVINKVGRDVILSNFLGNFSTRMDFLEFHEYKDDSDPNYYDLFNTTITNLKANCTAYGANCGNIKISEWGVNNATIQNSSSLLNQYSSILSSGFASILNNFPANVSLEIYDWAEIYNYNNSVYYPEYPKRWASVSEPLLDNAIYPPYNVTKYFATYCPSGGTVYSSSSDDATVKTVSCRLGSQYANILINTDTSSKNITVNSSNTGYLMDKDTGTLYAPNTNSNLGIVDSYIIKYLVTPNFTLSESSGFTKSAATGESYSSSEVYVSSSTTNNRNVYSNLTNAINATVIFSNLNCNNVVSLNYTPSQGPPILLTSTAAKDACNSFNGQGYYVTLGPGINQLILNGILSTSTYCTVTAQAFGTYPVLIGLVGTIFFIGLIVLILFGFVSAKSGFDFSPEQVGIFILTLIGIGVLVIVAIVIFSNGGLCF